MSNDNSTKKYPVATPEIAALLGMDKSDSHSEHAPTVPVADLPIANLPVAHSAKEDHSPIHEKVHESVGMDPETDLALHPVSKSSALVKVLKSAIPYVAVFVVGLFLYYFFFSSVNFSSLLSFKNNTPATPKETALQQLEKQDLTAYNKWISGFYYDVSDAKVLDPETDNSGNGLSNFQKYLLKLNPKSYDTLGLGMADSQALAMNISPVSGGQITDAQKDIMSKYVDMEVVMNRLALSNMQNQGRVAGAAVGNNTYYNGSTSSNSNINNNNYNGNYNNNSNSNNNGYSITPTSGSDDIEVNTSVAGRLEIPDLKISVPIMWTSDPKNFDKDLQSGVVHYPGTAMPGQIGTTYISGHSSNYVWAKGSYNKIFSTLGDLADNTSFKITVVHKNGKVAIFHYVVTSRKEYSPTDQEQFKNTGKSIVALSTCWPVGSTAKRLVVFGTLTQVEK
ncbi:MAG: sortase [Candidatus Doudnabacteria bacterium]|nr:sortase [Candidatus Doudnabacteria bacterium]